ncbi:hypothetical protein SOCE26_080230 [Sorangium cellulosum]|uniref:Secreted protein n=1 Tax=Sorangium cellulosum TaxID=56 RepID=A0A2L0F4R1_SORCE|nr:hypothetical protein [Sorangium cellulosum]AUX46517.1 hypothetical protein SOCE26_080230 [Sorangium cellulosum]
MFRKTLAAALPLSLALAAVPREGAASNYPPSYNVCGPTTTVHTGPFEIIQDPVREDCANLTVAYRGYLRDSYPDHEIAIYIRLNGQDVLLPASAGAHDDAYVFASNAPRDCAWCSPSPYSSATPSVCGGVQLPPGSSGRWVCNGPTPTEQELFFWAYNEYGDMNAWDIELAAESHGEWDSNLGANYAARFEPRTSCF